VIDLDRLRRTKLRKWPFAQILIGNLFLAIDYRIPRRTQIEVEGFENIPRDRGVFFALNHTDRYNYWPFQYAMYRHGGLRYTATWVKGKYYENKMMAWFLDITGNIPVPSQGYLISAHFRKATGSAPGKEQYQLLRDLVDEKLSLDDARQGQADATLAFLEEGFAEYAGDSFIERFHTLWEAMMAEVVALTRRALEDFELNVLIFPQGTRSIRLSQGHTGLAQMAQHLSTPIVPVGCNGSNRLYPGNSPFSRGGRVVYRIGRPLEVDGPELAPYRVPPEILPLTTQARRVYGDRYQAITQVVMNRINELLDSEYQFATDAASDGVQGVARLL
jgi:1-acyl-sn-glycerol-3-phosphate acyltransferase